MSDSQKHDAIINIWKHDAEFSFASLSFFENNCRFLLNRLIKLPWLEYSEKLDVFFCFS